MTLARTALVFLALAASAPACNAAFRGKHFDRAVALHTLGKAAVEALEQDQKEGHCRTKDPKRCAELCQGKVECMEICDQVKTMICSANQVVTVSRGDTTAAAAAAAAAASSAVQDAVKEGIREVSKTAKQASEDARTAINNDISKIQEVTLHAARTASVQAAAAAAEAASHEAAAAAHMVASTAAAASVAAANAPKGGAAAAQAPAPVPAPAF